MAHGLFGKFFVVPTSAGLQGAWKPSAGSAREFQKLRRHWLRLAFWPGDSQSAEFDIDWDWIHPSADRIGEMRIDERIAGFDNIRIIFFKSNLILEGDPEFEPGANMKRIWLLDVFQKKTQRMSAARIEAWRAMKTIVVQRYYEGNPAA